MFTHKKDKSKRQDTHDSVCLCDRCAASSRRELRGSYTVEAACILPLVLLCFVIAIEAGIQLQTETKALAEELEKEKPIDIIACMYRKEYLEEIIEGLYEN